MSVTLQFTKEDIDLMVNFIDALKRKKEYECVFFSQMEEYGIDEELNQKMFLVLYNHFEIIENPGENEFYYLNRQGRVFDARREFKILQDDTEMQEKETENKKKGHELTTMQLEHVKRILIDYDETRNNARTAKHIAWISIIVNIILTAYIIWSKA